MARSKFWKHLAILCAVLLIVTAIIGIVYGIKNAEEQSTSNDDDRKDKSPTEGIKVSYNSGAKSTADTTDLASDTIILNNTSYDVTLENGTTYHVETQEGVPIIWHHNDTYTVIHLSNTSTSYVSGNEIFMSIADFDNLQANNSVNVGSFTIGGGDTITIPSGANTSDTVTFANSGDIITEKVEFAVLHHNANEAGKFDLNATGITMTYKYNGKDYSSLNALAQANPSFIDANGKIVIPSGAVVTIGVTDTAKNTFTLYSTNDNDQTTITNLVANQNEINSVDGNKVTYTYTDSDGGQHTMTGNEVALLKEIYNEQNNQIAIDYNKALAEYNTAIAPEQLKNLYISIPANSEHDKIEGYLLDILKDPDDAKYVFNTTTKSFEFSSTMTFTDGEGGTAISASQVAVLTDYLNYDGQSLGTVTLNGTTYNVSTNFTTDSTTTVNTATTPPTISLNRADFDKIASASSSVSVKINGTDVTIFGGSQDPTSWSLYNTIKSNPYSTFAASESTFITYSNDGNPNTVPDSSFITTANNFNTGSAITTAAQKLAGSYDALYSGTLSNGYSTIPSATSSAMAAIAKEQGLTLASTTTIASSSTTSSLATTSSTQSTSTSV